MSHFLSTFGIRSGQSASGLPIEKPNGSVIRLTSLDTLPDQNADSESQSVTKWGFTLDESGISTRFFVRLLQNHIWMRFLTIIDKDSPWRSRTGFVIRLSSRDTLPDQDADSESQFVT